ncbi:MAG: YbdK family carboxylate-amine ligase [Actinomycetota bacterium]|nr:YbdK family carboxylate-amine ligase [Actinomycetota bacterium]
MGDAQKLSPDEQIRRARDQFDGAPDFTLAVEEEFAILDPETLSLVNRFEELQAASRGTELEGHLVGELIASEVEVRTGRCDSFEDAADRMGERRDQLSRLADQLGVALAATATHPWSPWQEQRIIDTPHYRRNDEILRYVVWRNNTFGIHVHVGIRGADRAVRVCGALRNYLPDLLALSASSPFLEGVYTYLHSARTQIFTKMFPRCGIPDPFSGWPEYERYVRYLYATGSIDEHTQLWWSVRPHLAFPTVEIRICDAQPDLGEARSLAALAYALTARIARALDEREPLPERPRHLLEENFWRAIRHGLAGELIDLSAFPEPRVRPARAAVEELIGWVLPVAEELGVDQHLAVPAANAAERQIARYASLSTETAGGRAGASSKEILEEIYGEQVLGTKEAVSG